MREILFKAKKVTNGKKWMKGYYFYDSNTEKHFLCNWLAVGMLEVDPDTICQSTEMNAYWDDLEGELEEALVWEHDLLEVDYEGKKVIAEVKFECGMFILASNEFVDSYIPLFDVVQLEDQGWIDAKVVGNIFDNPELLNIRSEHEFE